MQGIADWFAGIWQQFEFNIIQGDRYTMLLDGPGHHGPPWPWARR